MPPKEKQPGDTDSQQPANASAKNFTPPDPIRQVPNPDQPYQLLLQLQYQQLVSEDRPLPDFDQVQFRAYSQNGEDGILLYIFSLIGTTNKKCVEICAAEGIQCNTANLIINHGWRGLLLDGDDENLDKGRRFYRECQDTFISPPKLVKAWITVDNVNDILRYHNYSGEIDLLSLDLDGNDYWIWKALDAIQPRVVILEYQASWGPTKRMTQRYVEDFCVKDVKVSGGLPRAGASLGAFVALAKDKGYRLIGCERLNFNAVFIREGLAEEYFPEVPAAACFDHPRTRVALKMMEEKGHLLPDMWEEV